MLLPAAFAHALCRFPADVFWPSARIGAAIPATYPDVKQRIAIAAEGQSSDDFKLRL
jgi:hypothetical protein